MKNTEKLSKKEKNLIIKAAMAVDKGYETFSCNAIDKLTLHKGLLFLDLVEKYQNFCTFNDADKTFGIKASRNLSHNRTREIRVLLLLTFAEIG